MENNGGKDFGSSKHDSKSKYRQESIMFSSVLHCSLADFQTKLTINKETGYLLLKDYFLLNRLYTDLAKN